MSNILIYSINKHYRKVRVWSADPETKKLLCASTLSFNKGVKLAERRRDSLEWLKECFDITPC